MDKTARKVVSNACDGCKAGKRRCDGKDPCGYCTRGNKVCAFTKIDKRRRRTTHSPSFATEPPRNPPPLPPSTSTNSAAATSTERSRDCDADYNAVAGPSGTYTSYEAPLTTSAPPREEHHDQEILASLVQAIGVEAPDHASPPTTDSANPIEGIHRHLKKVFSMRSVVDDEQEHLLERDEDLASFFLPSEEEGMSYITCFFAHAASTYRYLDESEMTGLAHRFFAREPDVLADPLSSALVLVVMAVGCLWTSSWTGADSGAKTSQAIQLYLASKRRVSSTAMVPPRLVSVHLHLATTHFLLGLSRYQSAWLSFGTAGRLSLLLCLHRATPFPTDTEVEGKRRKTFWSAFMMDRFLSLVLGLPAFFNENDLTTPYPEIDTVLSPQARGGTDSSKMLVGSVAHFKLSRILGHALDALRSPKDLSPADRTLRTQTIEGELHAWRQETPPFFHPPSTSELVSTNTFGDFAQIPPLYERQQWRVRSTYAFIRLLLYRSHLLDELLSRLRRAPSNWALGPSPEMNTCVLSALHIADTASTMQGKRGSGGMFWSTSFFAFSSISCLLVFLSLYPDTVDRAKVESVIERAMQSNEGDEGSEAGSSARQMLLQETRRISALLRPAPAQIALPPTSSAPTFDFGSSTADVNSGLPDLTFPFLFPGETAGTQVDAENGDWDSLFADLQGLVETGFTQQYFPPTF